MTENISYAPVLPPRQCYSQKQIENIIQITASLPNTSGLREKITDAFVSTLWDNLEHPPLSYLGDQFKYRTADGSYNVCIYTAISNR
jgi:hypothetical protein